jgi:hypothetical protein
MTTHEARTAKIVEALRQSPLGKWTAVKLACIGTVYVHRVPVEACTAHGFNEIWCRIGSPTFECETELRGSAEAVAKRLCLRLRAPSKAVAQAIEAIKPRNISGLRGPEIAAILGLNDETTYRAIALLEEMGLGSEGGEYGWRYAA